MYYFMQIVNVLYGDERYHAQVKMKLVSSLYYVFLINAKLCSYVKSVLHAINVSSLLILLMQARNSL